jgi:hypothetical protein
LKSIKFKNIKNHLKRGVQMKTNKLITRCPITNDELIVKKLYSPSANITIEGDFHLSKYNYLDDELLYFMEIFIKNRGNIKAVEKEMSISYPTVKKMLDDLIINLGYNPEDEDEEPAKPTRKDILSKVEKGLMSLEEAMKKIEELGEKYGL